MSMLPEGIDLTHARGTDFFVDDIVYDQLAWRLHLLKEALGNYKLARYYMSGRRLAITYRFEHVNCEFVFCCKDAENALAKVSKGKCSIVEQVNHQSSREVVCDVAEGGVA